MIIARPGSEKVKLTEQLAASLEPLERGQLVGERSPGPVLEKPMYPDGGVGWPTDVSVTVVVHELGRPITTEEGGQVWMMEVVLGGGWTEGETELVGWVSL